MTETLFVADLHLDGSRPEKLTLFQELLAAAVGRVRAFYILGDLFESWVGDDDLRPPHPQILTALSGAASKGLPIYFMRGNRDFLVGDGFQSVTGCVLIPDPSLIELNRVCMLLTHGDSLCTGDVRYHRYRRLINRAWLRAVFLALPLRWRQRIAGTWRRRRSRPSPVRVDVEQKTVERVMQDYRVQLLIHGHTHRLDRHEFDLAGKPACRYVLGAWYQADSILLHRPDGFQSMSAQEYVSCADLPRSADVAC